MLLWQLSGGFPGGSWLKLVSLVPSLYLCSFVSLLLLTSYIDSSSVLLICSFERKKKHKWRILCIRSDRATNSLSQCAQANCCNNCLLLVLLFWSHAPLIYIKYGDTESTLSHCNRFDSEWFSDLCALACLQFLRINQTVHKQISCGHAMRIQSFTIKILRLTE